jgi:hypothetical protein
VQGPLAEQKPLPVLVGKVTAANPNSGSVFVTLPDGERCEGKWKAVDAPSKTTTTSADASSNLAGDWDLIYGSGFYVSHVLGARSYARAQMAGGKGTKVEFEMYRPDTSVQSTESHPLQGVAKDDKGNVYKVTFSPN